MFCFCAESRRAARLLTARYDRYLFGAGVTAAQFEVLSVLSAMKKVHGRALAQALAIDPATLSRNLALLYRDGLVRPLPSKEDARQTLYKLTQEGYRRLNAAKPLWQEAHRIVEAELGEAREPVQSALLVLTAALRE